jgi:TPR repeat protein
MAAAWQNAGFQERGARRLLLLTLVHTVPVIWLTPVAGGTAPTVVLLAVGLTGLFSFDAEGLAMGLMALVPGLLYVGLAWVLAWLLAKGCARLPRTGRLGVLAVLVAVPLAAVYFPIYVAGGHNSSSSASLVNLLDGYPQKSLLLTYWIALHLVLVGLFAGQIPVEGSPAFRVAVRWTRPALELCAVALLGALVYVNSVDVICRPLAHLGNDAAQLCVARTGGVDARYWYERAADDGNAEALAWMVEHTPDRSKRLEWLRRGARAGDPASQYQLAEHLRRYGPAELEAEAARALQAAASAGYGPAQMALAEEMTTEVLRTGSRELLAQRNTLLEQAAEDGSRVAKLRLAEHYSRGSMGYPVHLERARAIYQVLAEQGELTAGESPTAQLGDSYQARLQQLDEWQVGLAAHDPRVTLELAKLYLRSPLPGPGVRALAMRLFEEVAADDPSARQELIVMLRTGTDGADKDLDGARKWLLEAARAGEADAMARVARNYMDGREGFPQDYPEARVWIEALIEHYRRAGGGDASRRVVALQADLKYIDRLDEMAGGRLLGPQELEDLGGRTDPDSQYRYALQLLAGGGPLRRDEAVSRLQQAADLGHAEAAWRLVQVYERGFPRELNSAGARRELERAASLHHFEAIRELASRYEYGNKGYAQDLPRAIEMYEAALAAGRDNRYGWNLSEEVFSHFPWLESRLRQARMKLEAQSRREPTSSVKPAGERSSGHAVLSASRAPAPVCV